MHYFTEIDDMRHLSAEDADLALEELRTEAVAAGGMVVFQDLGDGEMLSEEARFELPDTAVLALLVGEHETYLFPLGPAEVLGLAALRDPAVSQASFRAIRVLNDEAFEPVEAELELRPAGAGSLRLREARLCFASDDWLAALAAAGWGAGSAA